MAIDISWLDFMETIAILILAYLFLKIVLRFIPQVFQKKSSSDKFSIVIIRILELYIPIAILIVLFTFVNMNYKVHGILLLAVVVLFWNYIKSYINGVFFKVNPLIAIGNNISTGEFNGNINKFLPFGIIINDAEGNRFINYTYIDSQGFNVNQNVVNSMFQTLFLQDIDNSSMVLDLLFDNPIINFKYTPQIRKLPNENLLELQISLEKGVEIETLIGYLNQNNIKTSITKTI
jgi:hypothetical protein